MADTVAAADRLEAPTVDAGRPLREIPLRRKSGKVFVSAWR
jgi:hypothetical protein